MRAAVLALTACLLAGAIPARADAVSDSLSVIDPWTWRGAAESEDANLRLFEVGRDTVGGRIRVRYKALALGLAPGSRLTAWAFPVGVPRGVCLQSGFVVDSTGRVACAGATPAADTCAACTLPLDQIVLTATAYMRAEPYRVGLVSADGATRAYAEAFPFPLSTTRDSLALHLELARPDGLQFAAVGEGFPPGKEIGVTIRSEDRSTGYKMTVPTNGGFRIVVYPQVAGKQSGFASITVESGHDRLTLDWPWGEAALRSP